MAKNGPYRVKVDPPPLQSSELGRRGVGVVNATEFRVRVGFEQGGGMGNIKWKPHYPPHTLPPHYHPHYPPPPTPLQSSELYVGGESKLQSSEFELVLSRERGMGNS